MSHSLFDQFNSFIRRRYRLIIIAWVVAVVLSLTVIPSFFGAVSYDIMGLAKMGGSRVTESQTAQNILDAQFPASNSASTNDIILVIQPTQSSVYSDIVKNAILELNRTIASDPNLSNYTGTASIYTVEQDLLNSTVPEFIPGVGALASNVTTINQGFTALQQNLTMLNSNIFQLMQGINQTSQMIYGIPSAFVQIFEGITFGGQNNTLIANQQANQTIYTVTGNFGGNAQSIGYYTAFFNYWSATFQTAPTLDPTQREAIAVNGTVVQFASQPSLDNSTRALIMTVATELNATDWNQNDAIGNLTLNTIALQIPGSLTASLGVTPSGLALDLYNLGPSPTGVALSNLAIPLITNSFTTGFSLPFSGFSIKDLIADSCSLGANPDSTAVWNLAAEFFANATASSFASSPLFTINVPSLRNLLSGFTGNTSNNEIQTAINGLISNESFSNYPLTISNVLTKNFVGLNNDTMIVMFNFASKPSDKAIQSFRSDVGNSTISALGATYVTGSPVVYQDFQNVFVPVLEVTVLPGIIVSIVIVALLFRALLAAIIPLLMGGVTIIISYATIYLGVVDLGHGSLTFLTPTLATLLVLGLAVDYSVLQLRRTREERTNGKSKEESVATSVRWAGQAVITAGITVIVAYVVMAVVNVPIFSDVGTAIALGVSVLLLASITLLPSLELFLGDKLFWPNPRVKKQESRHSLLARISDVTLKRKAVVAVLITLFAAGAFYVTAITPTGADMLRLIPNFESNQGLTAITDNLGSGTISPTTILITTPTPIVYGNNQFNQTLLNQIEMLSSNLSASSGIQSLTGPTRPYGSTFNYSAVQDMPEPLHSQYLSGMLTQIGKDNKTILLTIGLTSRAQSAQAVTALLQVESEARSLQSLQGMTIHYGGTTQATYDNQAFLNGLLPEVTIILVTAVYVILFFQLRSAFTPIRLLFTILCSVAFSLALLAITFHYMLSLPILDFAPLFVVVTMLGVGIDYDIFYITRIREEVLNGKTDKEAIKTATTKVWITILGLGLVLASVFGSLLLTGIALLQEISLAVSAAVLIDVTIVILFFVPSLMALAEKLNWWPSKIRRNPNDHAHTQNG